MLIWYQQHNIGVKHGVSRDCAGVWRHNLIFRSAIWAWLMALWPEWVSELRVTDIIKWWYLITHYVFNYGSNIQMNIFLSCYMFVASVILTRIRKNKTTQFDSQYKFASGRDVNTKQSIIHIESDLFMTDAANIKSIYQLYGYPYTNGVAFHLAHSN